MLDTLLSYRFYVKRTTANMAFDASVCDVVVSVSTGSFCMDVGVLWWWWVVGGGVLGWGSLSIPYYYSIHPIHNIIYIYIYIYTESSLSLSLIPLVKQEYQVVGRTELSYCHTVIINIQGTNPFQTQNEHHKQYIHIYIHIHFYTLCRLWMLI